MLAKPSAQLRLISSLLCAVVVAACGGSVAAQPSPLETVTVRFAVRQSAANYSALADEFHRQHPNVTIQIISNMQGPALKTLTALGVDAFRDTVAVRPDPQLKDALLPLDEWINADKNFPRADILSGALAATRSGGAQYGIPAGLSQIVAYYDAARFKAVQATPPSADWTLSDFLQAAVSTNRQETQEVDNPNFAYGFCSLPVSSDPIIFTYLLGGQLVDNPQDPTVPMLDSAINQRALEWYAALRTQYALTPDPDEFAATFSTRGVTEASMRSKCGLWLGSYASQGNRPAAARWLGEPVMLPLPRGQATLAVASMDAYYILRQSTHRNETWQWLAFLLNHQEAAGSQIPVRRSLIDSVGFASRVPADALRVARNLPDNVLVLGGTQQDEQSIYTIYLEAVDLVVRDKAGAHAALVEAQRKAMALFSP